MAAGPGGAQWLGAAPLRVLGSRRRAGKLITDRSPCRDRRCYGIGHTLEEVKLQQLRFLVAVAQSDLSITAAAARLSTTQPGISKQLKALEHELGFDIFVRKGRALTGITSAGHRVLAHALEVARETRNINGISADFRHAHRGSLSLGTTHTQARYVLPPVIQRFRSAYPGVEFHLHQGTSEQIAEMARMDRINFAIATGSHELFDRYPQLPWYHWHHRVIVPAGHPLAAADTLTLERLAEFPIVTYAFSFSGRSSLSDSFHRVGLHPNIVLTARDAEVIKTYVRLGLGAGIVAGMALDPVEDTDIISIDVSHLLSAQTTWVGFSRGSLLRGYMYEFLQLLAPHLTRALVDRAASCDRQEEVEALFEHLELPVR